MKKEGLGGLYGHFTGGERFQLYIEALSRGDEMDAERLIKSSPRETYSICERAFTDRCRASETVTTAVCLDLAPRLAKLTMLRAFREALPLAYIAGEDVAFLAHFKGFEAGARRAWAAAGKKGDPPGWENGDEEDEAFVMEGEWHRITLSLEEGRKEFVKSLQNMEERIGTDALTIWEAFSDFCIEELLLEPEKLVKVWFEPILPEIEKLKNLQEEYPKEVNPERHKEYARSLKELERSVCEL